MAEFDTLRHRIRGKYPRQVADTASRKKLPVTVVQAAHCAWVDCLYEWCDMELPSDKELYEYMTTHGTGTPILLHKVLAIAKRERIPLHNSTAASLTKRLEGELLGLWEDQIAPRVEDD